MSTLNLTGMLVFDPEQVNEPCCEVISGAEQLWPWGQGSNHYVPLRTSVGVEITAVLKARLTSYFQVHAQE